MGGLDAMQVRAALYLTTLGRQGIQQNAMKRSFTDHQNTPATCNGRGHERFAMTGWTIHFNPSLLAVAKIFSRRMNQ
jgi:hypothetical protein